jgi:WD40 repeat protein
MRRILYFAIAGAVALAIGLLVVFWPRGQELASFGGHSSLIRTLIVSPNGDRFASADDSGKVIVREFPSGRIIAEWTAHTGSVNALAFGPNSMIATGGKDKSIKLWDCSTGTALPGSAEHHDYVAALSFDPTGKLLASAGHDKAVSIWSVEKLENKRTFKDHKAKVSTLAWSPNGKQLLAGDEDGSLHLYDPVGLRVVNSWRPHKQRILALAISPNGERFATAGRDGHLKVGRFASPSEVIDLTSSTGRIEGIGFIDNDLIASGGEDATIHLWDLTTKAQRATLKGHRGIITALAPLPGNPQLLTAGNDGTVKLWNVPK